MNAGAAAATGELLCFLHADTEPPADLVAILRHKFSDPRTTLLGFRSSIEVDGSVLPFFSAHHLAKTYYPIFLRPLSFAQGIRCVFGDQVQSVRAADFRHVGGFRSDMPIMEDADLCIRLHERGPSPSTASGYKGRGRVQHVVWPHCITSGRRLAAWGPLRGTWIHAVIGFRWYLGAEPQELHRLYREMYTDAYR